MNAFTALALLVLLYAGVDTAELELWMVLLTALTEQETFPFRHAGREIEPGLTPQQQPNTDLWGETPT